MVEGGGQNSKKYFSKDFDSISFNMILSTLNFP